MASQPSTLLRAYREKRDFAKTSEPPGTASRTEAGGGIFVVQKHAARALHYDFRIELDGVLMSWAVAKGPSLDPADKRLAVRVEDHPLDYAGFEGTIPKGEYGGGTVMLWDKGTWEPVGDPHEALKKGDLKFVLHGHRLKGSWVLVHMKGRDTSTRTGARENWLLIKHRDEQARDDLDVTDRFKTSVETGRDLDGIARGLKPRRKARGLDLPRAQVWTREGAVKLPGFRPPQLATPVSEVPTGDRWLFEIKYDGYRALTAIAGSAVRIFTRNGKDWTDRFARLREPLAGLTRGSALIDGEICSFNRDGRTDFSTLQQALSGGGPLAYFCFDLLEEGGEDLTGLPLATRKERLRRLLARAGRDSPLQFSDHVAGNGREVFDAICAAGHEGLLAKDGTSRYVGERTASWRKIKCARRQEFVIGGWRPSDKAPEFASLLVGSWDGRKLVYHGRVGTGFNQSSHRSLQKALDARARQTSPFADIPAEVARNARWVSPELVAEIAYAEFTADGILRHPSFLGLREDKPAKSVKLEKPADPPSKARATPAPPGAGAAPARSSKAVPDTAPSGKNDAVAAARALGVRLTSPDRVVYPDAGITKADLVAYYASVAEAMLPFVADRPLSLVRAPEGVGKETFFQKHAKVGFPQGFKQVRIAETQGEELYLYIEDAAGLVGGVQMNVLEWHIWGSRRDELEKPERIIFDIDPDEGLGFDEVKRGAADIRDVLGALGLRSYPMVTGGKGVHVIAPLERRLHWPEVKAFCRGFARTLSEAEPDRFLHVMSKARRKGKMFVDYLRNERGSTAIAPYSTRARKGAPVAVPVSWDELGALESANGFTLETAAARARDGHRKPWPGYFEVRQAITRAMLKAVGET